MIGDLISVIVPIYNIERYVGICIESILNQTYENLEIVLVDDGSKDKSSAICDLYAEKDKRIKVVHKDNAGLVSARKTGLKNAKGRYIGYVDGDDHIESTYLEHMYKEITKAAADVAISGYSRDLFSKTTRMSNNIQSGTYEKDDLRELLTQYISCGDFYKNGITTYVWNKLFDRELLEKFQMSVDDHISIGEDAAVVYPLLASCKKIIICDNCDYHYRQREDSMLKTSRPFSDEAAGLDILYKYLISKLPDKRDQIDDFILAQCIMRSGGISDKFNIYKKAFRQKRIVILSAGTFGQQLVNRINELKYCEIAGWLDEDYWEYRRCCLNVDETATVKDLEYDYILLATVDSSMAYFYKSKLIEMGVDNKKILLVNCEKSERKAAIDGYLEECNNA